MKINSVSLGWLIALELYDFTTWEHSRRVAGVAMSLARMQGFERDCSLYVWYGALLHDIGKLYIPQKILRKPMALSPEEWKVMRRHPVYANEMLSWTQTNPAVIDVVYCHHERWDGRGYPRGLKGEDIPLEARVFQVVDVWDALGSDRPYRAAWPQESIYDYLSNQAGKHFDPHIVDAFLGMKLKEPKTSAG